MEFCPKCGKMLKPSEEKDKVYLVCTGCEFKKESVKGYTKREVHEEKEEEIAISESQEMNLPQTEIECPDCGNGKAYYWIEQTRAADEAPTRFYKCTKCGNTWREYG